MSKIENYLNRIICGDCLQPIPDDLNIREFPTGYQQGLKEGESK